MVIRYMKRSNNVNKICLSARIRKDLGQRYRVDHTVKYGELINFQFFSRISHRLNTTDVKELQQFPKVIAESTAKETLVEELRTIYDVKTWLDAHIVKITKHIQPHAFKFVLQNGKCQMYFKKWSTDTEWLSNRKFCRKRLSYFAKKHFHPILCVKCLLSASLDLDAKGHLKSMSPACHRFLTLSPLSPPKQ